MMMMMMVKMVIMMMIMMVIMMMTMMMMMMTEFVADYDDEHDNDLDNHIAGLSRSLWLSCHTLLATCRGDRHLLSGGSVFLYSLKTLKTGVITSANKYRHLKDFPFRQKGIMTTPSQSPRTRQN